jgi:hypothetical protein
MARGLSSDLLTEINSGSIKPVALVEIGFPTVQRLTNHYKDLVHNANTYSAGGHLLKISAKAENSQINVANFSIQLSAVDNTFVAIVLNNVVSNDEVTIDVGFLDSNDALIDTFTFNKGFIDSYSIDTEKGRLVLNCTSHFSDFSRVAGRKTNSGSQQIFFPTDKGMEFAGLTVQDILWGKE